MPTYEYKCKVCGGVREITRAYDDDTIPVCCETSMERVWSSTPIHFKGGGFYSTDH